MSYHNSNVLFGGTAEVYEDYEGAEASTSMGRMSSIFDDADNDDSNHPSLYQGQQMKSKSNPRNHHQHQNQQGATDERFNNEMMTEEERLFLSRPLVGNELVHVTSASPTAAFPATAVDAAALPEPLQTTSDGGHTSNAMMLPPTGGPHQRWPVAATPALVGGEGSVSAQQISQAAALIMANNSQSQHQAATALHPNNTIGHLPSSYLDTPSALPAAAAAAAATTTTAPASNTSTLHPAVNFHPAFAALQQEQAAPPLRQQQQHTNNNININTRIQNSRQSSMGGNMVRWPQTSLHNRQLSLSSLAFPNYAVAAALPGRNSVNVNTNLALLAQQQRIAALQTSGQLDPYGPSIGAASSVAPRNVSEVVDDTPITKVLSQEQDILELSSYQCLIRKQIEVFEEPELDERAEKPTAQGRIRPVVVGQVGIRCRHCWMQSQRQRGKYAVLFPSTLLGLYQAAQSKFYCFFVVESR